MDEIAAKDDAAFRTQASDAGFDSEELVDYAKHLQVVAKDVEGLSPALEKNKDSAEKVALSFSKLERGAVNLNKNFKDYKTLLVDANKGTKEYSDSVNNLRADMGDLLNTNGDLLSEDFLVDPKTMDLTEKALKGEGDAMKELMLLASQDIMLGIEADIKDQATITKLENLRIQAEELLLNNPLELEIGDPLVDTSGFIDGLNDMIASGAMTADQVNGYLGSMGFSIGPTTEWKDAKVWDVYDYVNPVFDESTTPPKVINVVSQQFPYQKNIKTPVISTLVKTGDGKTNANMAESAVKNGGGGKSGGGGGSKGSKPPKAAAKVKPVDYTKRYEDIESAIDETTNAMNKYSKASDHAFGTTKLALMDKERKEIEKLGAEYKSLYEEASDYYKLDVKNAKSLDKESTAALKKLKTKVSSAKIEPPKMEFLEDGTLSNPEAIRKFWTAAANDALIPYNKLLDEQKKKLEEIGDVEEVNKADQEWLDNKAKEMELAKEVADEVAAAADIEIKKMEQVVETAKKMQEALEKAIDNIRDWLSKELAAIQYKVDVRVKINERDVAIMNQLISRLGDKAENTAKKISMIFDNARSSADNMTTLMNGAQKTLDLMENMNDPKNQKAFQDKYGPKAWAAFKADGTLPKEMSDQLDSAVDAMMSEIDKMYAMNDEIWASYMDAMEKYISEFDDLLSGFDNHASMLDDYLNMWEKSGKAFKDPTVSLMLLNKQVDNAGDKVIGLKAKWDYAASAA
jgi:hypothetical protein